MGSGNGEFTGWDAGFGCPSQPVCGAQLCPQSPADLLLHCWESPQCPFTKSSFIYASLVGFQFSIPGVPCLEQYVARWAHCLCVLAPGKCSLHIYYHTQGKVWRLRPEHLRAQASGT